MLPSYHSPHLYCFYLSFINHKKYSTVRWVYLFWNQSCLPSFVLLLIHSLFFLREQQSSHSKHYRSPVNPVCRLCFLAACWDRAQIIRKGFNSCFVSVKEHFDIPLSVFMTSLLLPERFRPMEFNLEISHSPSFALLEDFPNGVFLHTVLFWNLRRQKGDMSHILGTIPLRGEILQICVTEREAENSPLLSGP